jgi:phosphatidylinositol 4-kinase
MLGRKRYSAARNAFIQSLAGYSLLIYILQIKDRHNGNILLDSKGHMVHIDFGFMLSNSPGNLQFEVGTFKLTQEYVELMGGQRSKHFARFRNSMVKGFLTLRDHSDELISFVEMTMVSGLDLPCF